LTICPPAPASLDQVEVSFHSIAYLLTVSTVNGDTLCLEVEQKSDASRWKGDFTARCRCSLVSMQALTFTELSCASQRTGIMHGIVCV